MLGIEKNYRNLNTYRETIATSPLLGSIGVREALLDILPGDNTGFIYMQNEGPLFLPPTYKAKHIEGTSSYRITTKGKVRTVKLDHLTNNDGEISPKEMADTKNAMQNKGIPLPNVDLTLPGQVYTAEECYTTVKKSFACR